VKRAFGAAVLFVLLLTGCMPAFHRGAMPGEPRRATFAQVDGVRVRYVDVGKGPAVVLLHGFASSLDAWNAVIPVLAKSHRVIALDLKGFGWSGRPPGDYSPLAEAKLVFDLLNQRRVDRVAIVAHSWGCSIALRMALLHPERVTRLALYDAWVYEEQLPSTFQWARADGLGEVLFDLFYKQLPAEKMSAAFYDQRYMTQDLVDRVKAALDRPGTTAAALAAVRGQRFYVVQTHYKQVAQPVLLLWGREDRVAPLSVADRLLRDLPDSHLIVYPRCGHFPMIEAEAASTRDLARFLSDEPAATAAPAPPSSKKPAARGS
jgi:pimeloyl-ACP methyl ester carboxylesterase